MVKRNKIIDDAMEQGYFRYELLRRMNVHQFGVLFERNITLGIRFDAMVDRLRDLTPEGIVTQVSEWEKEIERHRCGNTQQA